VRRAAARALARIADDRAAELLGPALADEDAEVVAWSAYGLGYTTEKLGDSRESAIRYYCSAQQNVGTNTDLAREIAGRLAALGSACPE